VTQDVYRSLPGPDSGFGSSSERFCIAGLRHRPTPLPGDRSERHACCHALPQAHRDIVLPAIFAEFQYSPSHNAKRFLRSIPVVGNNSLVFSLEISGHHLEVSGVISMSRVLSRSVTP
jgi:hypothetical protein